MTRLLACSEKAEELRLTAQLGAPKENVQGYWLGGKHEAFVTMHQANILGEKSTEGEWGQESKLENHLFENESRCIKRSMKGNF